MKDNSCRLPSQEGLSIAFAKALAVFLRELGGGAAAAHSPGQNTADIQGHTPGREESTMLDLAEEAEAEAVDMPVGKARHVSAAELAQLTMVAATPLRDQDIRDRLKRAIMASKTTQKQLAAKLGVTPGVVTRILQEPTKSKVATLTKLTSAIGVPLSEVLAERGHSKPLEAAAMV